jgi:hypothetical protein
MGFVLVVFPLKCGFIIVHSRDTPYTCKHILLYAHPKSPLTVTIATEK